ncbi:hypothetical protein HY495_01145 [Candidatus Woesearchaeota archaeon]|nr:hypothetical protein [Candidatus Woesearchaeota archaeon]
MPEAELHTLVESWLAERQRLDARPAEEILLAQILETTKLERDELEKAANCLDWKYFSFSNDLVLPSALLLHHLKSTFVKDCDLSAILRDCAIPPFEMTPVRANAFSLQLLETHGVRAYGWEKNHDYFLIDKGEYKKTAEVYLDSPASFCLGHQGEPRCLISVLPRKRDELRIYQLQGITWKYIDPIGKYTGQHSNGGGCLGTLDWKKFLVSCVEQLARETGFKVVSVQSAENNRWVSEYGRLPLERGRQIYDQTAERLGYEQQKDQDWYREIDVKK